MFCREWQVRRVVITKEIISFAFLSDDKEIDYVPLHEVDFMKETNELGHSQDMTDMADENHAVQISTIRDGHNSGRAYYLLADSKESQAVLMACLQRNVKAAKKHAESKNAFRLVQLKVRRFYDSRPFQSTVALMIASVGRPSPRLPILTGLSPSAAPGIPCPEGAFLGFSWILGPGCCFADY